MPEQGRSHWLDRYGAGYHSWAETDEGFSRRCGLVEAGFDSDGRYYEGRADMSALLSLGVLTQLPRERLHRHVLLAFTLLRLHHPLLRAKAELCSLGVEPYFSVTVLATAKDAFNEAASALTFMEEDGHHEIDMDDFYMHAQNTARVIIEDHAMARAFVLPEESSHGNRRLLRVLFVMAHQIADGLSCRNWMSSLVKILNIPSKQIEDQISIAISPEITRNYLPPAQEDIYPPISGSKARQRWYWTLTIVLRHVRKPMPTAFPNPLRRVTALSEAKPIPQTYPTAFDYSRSPPLNTSFVTAVLSKNATKRLHRLSREAGASIGAGCFVLVAMSMMSLHEARYPEEPDEERRPFIGSFPLNPRPFIGTTSQDSVMLAFSEGIVLPFLPSHLDLEGRFRLLVRQASKQLSVYQKRKSHQNAADQVASMGSGGIGRLIASNYIDAIEKLRAKLPPNLQDTVQSPKGKYKVPGYRITRATCGVSSVGRVSWSDAQFDLDTDPDDGVIASVEAFRSGVRARGGEFLVSIAGEGDVIRANVSFNGNAIDKEQAPDWVRKMESMLEPDQDL
ncbi:Uu.00g075640.m01.CDS01 [Anthostomella pinea]|uniref:Uu.00g075640.m01.CDS01 n=1 Tax=Anthostomella pinea TaxID=933095 RepID=A0AAI8VWF6_9PEZI|nr:Uu.00g075640.m01.CDS01 [Anthostomella pinea]